MNKIKLLIFSKDRAAQLDLLLRSIQLNAPNLFEIDVLYDFSSHEYYKGYDLLEKYSCKHELLYPDFELTPEDDFARDVKIHLDVPHKYFAFATDDSILYRNLDNLLGGNAYNEIDSFFQNNYNVLCYSLRLGENVTHENYYGGPRFPNCYMYSNGISRAWNWKVMAPSTMGYPLSVDMHVFATQTLREIVTRATFDTPNSLEGNMSSFAHTLPQVYMGSPKLSAIVTNSINVTQSVWKNYAGGIYPVSLEELNQKYLDGWVVDLAQLDYSKIFAAHAEIEFKWKYEEIDL